MRIEDYSHREGKEILKRLHPNVVTEVEAILRNLVPFLHGRKKHDTVVPYISSEFIRHGWNSEASVSFKTEKKNYMDLVKGRVGIEIECSKFETFFRDFFRFMILHQRNELDAGILITLDEMAYQRWQGEAKAYKTSRASLQKLVDILKGDYAPVVTVPLWCIGLE